MFGIQKLLKYSLLLLLFFSLFSCAPSFISEEEKTALGFYSYEVGDVIEVQSNIDTTNILLYNKNISFSFNTLGGAFEIFEIVFKNKETNEIFLTIYISSLDNWAFFNFEDMYSVDLDSLNIVESLTIDGITYDSVYQYIDSGLGHYAYSTKEYGFIKIETDSITYRFIK